MMALMIREAEVRQLLTMPLALEAVEYAFVAMAKGRAVDVPRERTRTPQVIQHILQGALLDEGVVGYKVYTSSREGTRFLVYLNDANSGGLAAVVEANFLGMMRTGAASGVATRLLARQDARVMGLLGSGWQARGQLRAAAAVRQLDEVKVYARNTERLRAFCEEMSAELALRVHPVASAEAAVRNSDIVTTITTAATPVLAGEWLAPGTHVNAAGSNALWRREVDEEAVRRAALVAVDSRDTALREAGDLLPLLEKGRLHARQLVELGDIAAGIRPGRIHQSDITVFESQGLAVQDLAVAARLLALARKQQVGEDIALGA